MDDAKGFVDVRRRVTGAWLALVSAVGLLASAGCTGETDTLTERESSSCMLCHNVSFHDDYAGPGIENPHPFPGADNLSCETCHGGNPNGADALSSHVPPPPEIGDEEFQEKNATAYFNRLTLTGIDKFDDYTVDGVTYTALDYLQFVNPGDLRVVSDGRSCGQCHQGHAECVNASPLATEAGVLSGAMYAAGVENQVPENRGRFGDTAADLGFRDIADDDGIPSLSEPGVVERLQEFPVFSQRNGTAPDSIFNNDDYLSADLADDLNADNSVITGSPLANLYHEQVAFTCGDCHLGSAGANNRYGDFRSSGCTSCHMPYSQSGRSGSKDPNIPKDEPFDVDDIDEPERAHVRSHRIVSVAKTLPNGEFQPGIDDYACAGCHQGSNRTVMQFWGIRLDQNEDLRRKNQYPAAPASFQDTRDDTRLFDPVINNRTFNGRDDDQYILYEDYDGDDRDDTPPDVHYEAGMGCIDCHGSYDLHGGDVTQANGDRILSRMEQGVAIRCESCHGSATTYAPTVQGVDYGGNSASLAVDAVGNPLKHVSRDGNGDLYLTSRLTGQRHYIPQSRDTVVDTGKVHPETQVEIYTPEASFAMGRDDGNDATGIGPHQTNITPHGFAHADTMDCASCHASWTNTCMGCHLEGEYNTGNNFSNITGERIVFREKNADFVYQSPVFFQLGVNSHNKITQVSPNTKTFFQYEDRNNDDSKIFAFTDRNGGGNNPNTAFPSLSHNAMMAHSIRGRVDDNNEGPRYCVACHLTTDGLNQYGTEYAAFRNAMATNDFAALDFDLLATHFGRNTGNQMNSPFWAHMVAGLGTGLFLFDENGCPVNPLDDNDNRAGCDDISPKDRFDLTKVAFNLDRIVDDNGQSTGSSNHELLAPGVGPTLRDGSIDPNMAGPMGRSLIERIADPNLGIVLDSWLDADRVRRGDAPTHLGGQ